MPKLINNNIESGRVYCTFGF